MEALQSEDTPAKCWLSSCGPHPWLSAKPEASRAKNKPSTVSPLRFGGWRVKEREGEMKVCSQFAWQSHERCWSGGCLCSIANCCSLGVHILPCCWLSVLQLQLALIHYRKINCVTNQGVLGSLGDLDTGMARAAKASSTWKWLRAILYRGCGYTVFLEQQLTAFEVTRLPWLKAICCDLAELSAGIDWHKPQCEEWCCCMSGHSLSKANARSSGLWTRLSRCQLSQHNILAPKSFLSSPKHWLLCGLVLGAAGTCFLSRTKRRWNVVMMGLGCCRSLTLPWELN